MALGKLTPLTDPFAEDPFSGKKLKQIKLPDVTQTDYGIGTAGARPGTYGDNGAIAKDQDALENEGIVGSLLGRTKDAGASVLGAIGKLAPIAGIAGDVKNAIMLQGPESVGDALYGLEAKGFRALGDEESRQRADQIEAQLKAEDDADRARGLDPSFLGNLGRAINPWDDQRAMGVGDVSALQASDDDPFYTRLPKEGAAVAFELLTDPLNAIGGAGAAGKVAAGEAVKGGVEKALELTAKETAATAAKDAAEAAARETTDVAARHAAEAGANASSLVTDAAAQAGKTADEAGMLANHASEIAAAEATETAAKASADAAEAAAQRVRDIANTAAEARLRSATKMGKSLVSDLGPEEGQRVLGELNNVATNALIIRPPGQRIVGLGDALINKTPVLNRILTNAAEEAPTQVLKLSEGAGRTLGRIPHAERIAEGLGDLKFGARQLPGVSKVADLAAEHLSGKFGPKLAAVYQGLREGTDEADRYTLAKAFDEQALETAKAAAHSTGTAAAANTKLLFDTELSSLPDDAAERVREGMMNRATDIDVRGLAPADAEKSLRLLQEYEKATHGAFIHGLEGGLDHGELDAISRQPTEAAKSRMAEQGIDSPGQFDPTKPREANIKVNADGTTTWATPREINSHSEGTLIEDPVELLTTLIKRTHDKVADKNYLQGLKDQGLVELPETAAFAQSATIQPTADAARTFLSDRLTEGGPLYSRVAADHPGLAGDALDTAVRTDPRWSAAVADHDAYETAWKGIEGKGLTSNKEWARLREVAHSAMQRAETTEQDLAGGIASQATTPELEAAAALRKQLADLEDTGFTKKITDAATADFKARGFERIRASKVLGHDEAGNDVLGVVKHLALPDELSEAVAKPHVARALQHLYAIEKDPKLGYALYQDAMAGWKYMATIMNTAFNPRNAESGMINASVAGANAEHFAKGTQYAKIVHDVAHEVTAAGKGKLSLLEQADKLGIDPLRYYSERLQQKLSQVPFREGTLWDAHVGLTNSGLGGTEASLLAQSPKQVAGKSDNEATSRAVLGRQDFNVLAHIPDDAKGAAGFAKRTLNKAAVAGRPNAILSQHTENFLRMSSYLAGLDQYGFDEVGHMMARQIVAGTQFDYADLSPTEELLSKKLGIIPFYTWLRKNTPLQVRRIINQPGRVTNLVRGRDMLAHSLAGPNSEADNKLMPGYFGEALGFVTGINTPGGPLIGGLNDPILDLERLSPVTSNPLSPSSYLGAVANVTDDLQGGLGPLPKFLMETATQRNSFTGGEFSDKESSSLWSHFTPGGYQTADGKSMANDYLATQVRNMLPAFARVERLASIPGSAAHGNPLSSKKYEGRWVQSAIGATVGGALPYTPTGTLTEDQVGANLGSLLNDERKANERQGSVSGIDVRKLAQSVADANKRLGGDMSYVKQNLENGFFDAPSGSKEAKQDARGQAYLNKNPKG